MFASWITPAAYIEKVPNMRLQVHINVWLFQGKAPTDGQPIEIIINSFQNN
jgi:hypothetical protein